MYCYLSTFSLIPYFIMTTLHNKYRVIFENEFLFSNVIKVYIMCKHGNEYQIHYNSVCTENIIGGVLIQPEDSNYLQNCMVNMSTGHVMLDANIDRLNDCHRVKMFKWLNKHYATNRVQRQMSDSYRKMNCNFIIIPPENLLEIIELLYKLLIETKFFVEYDSDFVEYIINSRKLFCKTRFKISLS